MESGGIFRSKVFSIREIEIKKVSKYRKEDALKTLNTYGFKSKEDVMKTYLLSVLDKK